VCASGIIWHYQSKQAIAALAQRRNLIDVIRNHQGWKIDEQATKVVYAELVANVVLHAPGPIEITLECDGQSVQLRVCDQGPGFSFDPKLPPSTLNEGGRGQYLVSQFADNVRVEKNDTGGARVSATLLRAKAA
jgi:anti-sigma regulatory factor (Ser/Thr protein kinase)